MKITKLPIPAVVGAMLAATVACTPVSDTSAPQGQRTKEGAIGGAIAGALFGAAVADQKNGDVLEGALLGAAAGGALGGIVGADLDRQAAELRASLPKEATVSSNAEQIEVSLPEGLLFDVDSDTLKRGQRNGLTELAQSLINYPGSQVWIIGHTDNTGATAYNQALSERRARSVKLVLLQNGVAPSRLTDLGRGETVPVADNGTSRGRQQNRRVEVVIRPNQA